MTGPPRNARLDVSVSRQERAISHTGKVVTVLKSGYQFNAGAGVTTVRFTIQ